jgi:CheY-like chemotaxis protein
MIDNRFYIQVIDDLADAADSTLHLLSCWGYEAAAFYGGAAALNAAQDRLPDAVILDIGMPVMDGFEFVARFRLLPRSTASPIIAVTGHSSEECRACGRKVGIDRYVLKPADPGLLRRLLAEALPGRPTVLPRHVGVMRSEPAQSLSRF